MFVDDQLRVSGMIDWGMWCGGSLIMELATMALHLEGEDDLDVIMIAAGLDRRADPGLAQTFAVAVVCQAVGHVAHHVSIGDQLGLQPPFAALRRALTQLSSRA